LLNRVTVAGNLGKDPEVRTTPSGFRMVNFTIAVNEKYKDKQGNLVERTEWIPVSILSEPLGRLAEDRLRKGSFCYVEGKFETRKWTNKEGEERYSTQVTVGQYDGKILFGFGGNDAGDRPAASAPRPQQRAAPSRQQPEDDYDDPIPF
jgi:single-strand DNA-binding protein